jgi:predicted Zn-dependent peptidase
MEELHKLCEEEVSARELQKVKNKVESSMFFGEMGVLDKAMNLAFFELMGDADRVNSEVDRYQAVTAPAIKELASQVFCKENCSVLHYLSKEA